jgi:hypothetical protein
VRRALIRLGLILALAFTARDAVAGPSCAQRVARYFGKAVTADADVIGKFALKVTDGSVAEEGLLYALDFVTREAGEAAATRQVANILRTFPLSPTPFEWISKLREKPGLAKQIADLANRESATIFKGAASELRYAADVLGPTNVGSFQLRIPGGRPDIVDAAGGIHECKFRDWDQMPPFLVVNDLDSILMQADIAQRYAASIGKPYTLAFEVPLPGTYSGQFNTIFGQFLQRPGVTFVNGF